MLTVIIGPMFSGKTSYLIDIFEKNNKKNIETLVINHKFDNRYGKFLSNHDNKKIECCFIEKMSEIYKILNNIKSKKYKTILINEGQFFKDLYNVISVLVNYDYDIYVCGLNADSNMEKFGTILDIIPLADNVINLKSKCKICNKIANFTKRLNNNKDKILIGNDNLYIPVCRKCFN